MKKFDVKKMTDERDSLTTFYQVNGKIKNEELNDAVYAAMCRVGDDVLSVSKCRISGERTAVELAGKIAGAVPVFDLPEDANQMVRINVGLVNVGYKQEAPLFSCSFPTESVFEHIAEWEGAVGVVPSKVRKFHCESSETIKVTVKPYNRHHGYKPRRISWIDHERRINEKFETLGRLYRSLTSEGMRKAMSVVAAARLFDNKPYEIRAIIKEAMRWKLWKDYAKKKGAAPLPVVFGETDFQCGPECYKQVDGKYVQELVNHWNKMVADYPMPEWPTKGDMVQFRAHDIMKKNKGKYLCEGMTASLSPLGDRIEWRAAVRTKKYDCEYVRPELLIPAENTKKAAKKSKAKAESKPKPQVVPKQAAVEPSSIDLAEQLRQALLARLAA